MEANKGKSDLHFPDPCWLTNRPQGVFDVRFWGAAIAAKAAKIREGGSVTLTTGMDVVDICISVLTLFLTIQQERYF